MIIIPAKDLNAAEMLLSIGKDKRNPAAAKAKGDKADKGKERRATNLKITVKERLSAEKLGAVTRIYWSR